MISGILLADMKYKIHNNVFTSEVLNELCFWALKIRFSYLPK